MTDTKFTAEDFANAEFARRPDGAIAARVDDGYTTLWRTSSGAWLSDTDMATLGWVPVREAAAQPITLDSLQAAWEGAEQAEECVPGDVVIRSGEGGRYEVIPVEHGTRLTGMTRILHRAPMPARPEGAERLGALIEEWDDLSGSDEPILLADWLAERGVRVIEEGEK